MNRVYVIGSLRNPAIPAIGNYLRARGLQVFDDWFAAGPQADDHWKEYEQGRGHNFQQALNGATANNVFRFDKTNLDRSDAAVLVMPAGKSAHLELGYIIGTGKPGFILIEDDKDRWDVMYRFATGVYLMSEGPALADRLLSL